MYLITSQFISIGVIRLIVNDLLKIYRHWHFSQTKFIHHQFSAKDFAISNKSQTFQWHKNFYICLRTYFNLFVFIAGLDVYTILHRKNIILTLQAVQELEDFLCEDDRILINQFD